MIVCASRRKKKGTHSLRGVFNRGVYVGARGAYSVHGKTIQKGGESERPCGRHCNARARQWWLVDRYSVGGVGVSRRGRLRSRKIVGWSWRRVSHVVQYGRRSPDDRHTRPTVAAAVTLARRRLRSWSQ